MTAAEAGPLFRAGKMIAVCLGCGCDDTHACRGGCWWLRVDYLAGVGVCSECEAHIEAFDRGDHTQHARPAAESEEPALSRVPSPDPQGACSGDHDWPFEDVQDQDCCRRCGMQFLRHCFMQCP